jgi:hypothetical protein
MALYSLSYDLRKTRNYQPLYDELAKFGAIRVLESQWCFNRINTTAVGIRDYFRSFIDGDDGLFVCEITDWASVGTQGNPNQLK